jgi:O-antigen/teichoic acid export membrane protein
MNLLNKIIKHELISGSFYIFIGSILVNFLAFVLNLFLARNLSYADYGIFASLLSIITLASMPAGSINTILVRFTTDYHSKNQLDKLQSFYKKAAKFIFSFSLIALLFFIISSPLLKSFLHLNNVAYVVVVGLCVFTVYMQVLNGGFLQGLMKFRFLSFAGIFSGIIKLIVGIALVFLGFKAFSGLWAIFFMSLGSFLIGFIPLRFILLKKTESNVQISTSEIIKYALPTFIVVFSMTSLITTDVILVKHFFNAQAAGFYAGLSLIGRVIFYFTSPITMVMFPLLIKRYNLGRSFNNLFYLALFLVLIPSLTVTGFYFLFPKFVVNLFLAGRDYLSIAKYAGLFGINLTIFSLINLFVNFFLSLNKTKIAPLVVLAALSQIVLISIFHASFYQVIGVSISIFLVLFIALVIYYTKVFVNPKKIINSIPFFNNPTI